MVEEAALRAVAAVESSGSGFLAPPSDLPKVLFEGPEPGSRWRCQHEESLLKPTRVVLDIDPGPPHAAGRE